MKNKVIHNFVLTFSIDGEKYGDLLMLVPDSGVKKLKEKIIELALKESIKQLRDARRN